VPGDAAQRYLDLLKRALTGWLQYDTEVRLRKGNAVDLQKRTEGRDWPILAHTMIGVRRLDNVQHCVESVLRDAVPGDLVEAGVWRGGAAIFMRAILLAHGVVDRQVWLADSFAGLPPPNVDKYPQDAGLDFYKYPKLAVSLEQVQENFARYGLLDDQVKFLRGWFRDSLPAAPVEQIAVLRLDGDLYESTMDSLQHLYPKLSAGGFVILDDYGSIAACRQAVEDYRAAHAVRDPVQQIDWAGSYWCKS
jgi:O-methyltransferase